MILASLTTAACGSTVSPSALRAIEAESSGLGGAQTLDTSGGAQAATPSVITGQTNLGRTASGAEVGPTVTAGASLDPGPRPGITAKEIFVGLSRTTNAPRNAEAVGAEGVTTVDSDAVNKMLLDYFNKRGGIAGRKLVPVYHTYESQSTDPGSVQQQEACTTFTQDHKVFVALGAGGGETFEACMEKAGVLRISSAPSAPTSITIAGFQA